MTTTWAASHPATARSRICRPIRASRRSGASGGRAPRPPLRISCGSAASAQAVRLREFSAVGSPGGARVPSEGFVTSITHQSENFPEWYNDVVLKAELADYSPGSRLHDHPAVRLRHLGIDAGRARPPHQGDRPQQRLLPALRAALAAGEGSRARRGLQPAGRLGNPRRRQGARRMAGHPAHQRGDHRRQREGLDPVLSRPAAADEHLEQRRPLGAANAALPAHGRVPLAGGPHLPRHPRGSRGGGRDRPRLLRQGVARSGWPSRSSRAARPTARSSPAPSSRGASKP